MWRKDYQLHLMQDSCMLRTVLTHLTHLSPIPNDNLDHPIKISIWDASCCHGPAQALKHVSLESYKNEVMPFTVAPPAIVAAERGFRPLWPTPGIYMQQRQ
jgi:hypothetical protein